MRPHPAATDRDPESGQARAPAPARRSQCVTSGRDRPQPRGERAVAEEAGRGVGGPEAGPRWAGLASAGRAPKRPPVRQALAPAPSCGLQRQVRASAGKGGQKAASGPRPAPRSPSGQAAGPAGKGRRSAFMRPGVAAGPGSGVRGPPLRPQDRLSGSPACQLRGGSASLAAARPSFRPSLPPGFAAEFCSCPIRQLLDSQQLPWGGGTCTPLEPSSHHCQQACLLVTPGQPFRDFIPVVALLWHCYSCVLKPVGIRLVVTGLEVALPNPSISGHLCRLTVLGEKLCHQGKQRRARPHPWTLLRTTERHQ